MNEPGAGRQPRVPTWLEMRAAREPLRLAAALHRLPRRTSTTRVVLTIPGLGASDASMAPLRSYLRRLGHRAHGWGLGRNAGSVSAVLGEVGDRVRELADIDGTIDIVGWSLGGVIGRETARDHPKLVRKVVTYGSPVFGGAGFNDLIASQNGGVSDEARRRIVARQRVPLQVPVTAIYSKLDGVVPWQACIDSNPLHDVEHVEVRSSHVGMGLDPDVWTIVAERLST